MKNALFAAVIAAMSFGAHAGDVLRVAAYQSVAVTPVAVAAEQMPGVQFVWVTPDTIRETVATGAADCGVMSTREAVRLYRQTDHEVRIASGLLLDREAERDYQRWVLACSVRADEGAVSGLSKNLWRVLQDWSAGVNEDDAAGLAARAAQRAGMEVDAAQLAKRMVGARNAINYGVMYSLVPRDVMYAAGAEGRASITDARDLLLPDLRQELSARNRVAY